MADFSNHTTRFLALTLLCAITQKALLFGLPEQFEHYSTDKGLTHTHVLSLFQDSKGWLWIGTYGGLHAFDGQDFHIYFTKQDDSTTLSNPAVTVIFEAKDGTMWFGTEYGLNSYNRKSGIFTRYLEIPDNLRSTNYNNVKCISADDDENLWIGTYGGGIAYFNSKTGVFTAYNSAVLLIPSQEFDKVNTILDDKEGNLWIGTENGGIFIFNKKSRKIVHQFKTSDGSGLTDNLINSLFRDSENQIWVGTWNGGLLRFNQTSGTFQSFREGSSAKPTNSYNNIRSITEDNKGNLWLAHFGSGLSCFDKSNQSFRNFTYQKGDPNSLSNSFAWCVYFDRNGILWTGTFGGGINKLDLEHAKISLYQIPDKYTRNTDYGGVSALCEDHNKKLWLGTLRTGLFSYSRETGEFKPFSYSTNILENTVRRVFEDRSHQLWIGTDNGLFRIDSARSRVYAYKYKSQNPSGISDSPIYHIIQDSQGNIWLGTWNAGLNMLPANFLHVEPEMAEFIKYQNIENDTNSISHNSVSALYQDNEESIWVGTSRFLEKFSSGKFIHHPIYVVGSILEDKEGFIWVASLSDGIYKLNKSGKTILRHEIKEGLPNSSAKELPNSVILGMIADFGQNIWITTNKGISILNRKEQTFSNYSLEEDISGGAFIINAVTRLSSGAIALGCVDGFHLIWPNSLTIKSNYPPLVFTDFKLFNKSIVKENSGEQNSRIQVPAQTVNKLELGYNDNLLTIEFTALELASPSKIIYSYKLEGFDKEWITTLADRRYAYYSNLDPGKYEFKLRCTNSQGNWSPDIINLRITIKPPFWRTILFKILALVCFLILGSLFIWRRIQSLHTQKIRLEIKVEEKTAEIKNQNKILELKNEELSRQTEEILNQKNEIIEMTRQVREADDKKMKFFTSISHEFRTPLTLIIGPVEQLLEDFKGKTVLENQLQVVHKNSLRLLRLINELLDFRKMDTHNMKPKYSKGDMIEYCAEIVSSFQNYAIKQQVELRFDTNQNHFTTLFDAGKMEIIFYNLLSNAFKFTKGGGKICFSVTINTTAQQLEFKMRDTGIGIEPDQLENIFNRFYRVESSSLLNKQGIGIGLALTKDIVKILGGDISVESAPGQGSCFSLRLPIVKESEITPDEIQTDLHPSNELLSQFLPDHELQANQNSETFAQNGVEKEIVLIVEDNADLRGYVKKCLFDKYEIIEAANGKEGLQMASDNQPGLIISDIMMPEMDGITFCKQIKSNLVTSHIPIILLSALNSLEIQLEGFETGADAYIAKPFNKSYLRARVKNMLASRAKLRELFGKKILTEPSEIAIASIDEAFLVSVRDIIETHMEEPEFGTNELVAELGMSRTLVHMKFKKLVNLSTSEFIKTMRLNRAAQLLSKNKHRISDICYLSGFSDPHHFSKVFKKHFGLSPTEYTVKGNGGV